MVKILEIIFVLTFILLTIVTSQYHYSYQICPDNSDGSYPTCICRYAQYDEELNTCINLICPTNSTGTHPHCKCTEKNFDYSIELNECFRVCPENSTGYWPNCVCDKRNEGFKLSTFECLACPSDSKNGSVYPNCVCTESGKYNKQSNFCEKCRDSKGIYPDCECDDKTTKYNPKRNECEFCPEQSNGIFPDCECLDNGVFENGHCKYCPIDSSGTYGNCVCENKANYNKNKNDCILCPEGSTGIHPDCECFQESFQYDHEYNNCFECPADIPNCECINGVFNIRRQACFFCPENSTGIYPDCECTNQGHMFSAFINECYIPCPEDSTGKHPNCRCDKFDFYYDENDRVCKSNVGRRCPKLSIGTGPNCLCTKKDYIFNLYFWQCQYRYAAYGAVSVNCPDSSQKWPQCDVSIHRNALLSLVG